MNGIHVPAGVAGKDRLLYFKTSLSLDGKTSGTYRVESDRHYFARKRYERRQARIRASQANPCEKP
jgi:hypothetical protein